MTETTSVGRQYNQQSGMSTTTNNGVDFCPRLQKYSALLSFFNGSFMLGLGICLLVAPLTVVHVLLDYPISMFIDNDHDGDDDTDSYHQTEQAIFSVTRMAGGVLIAQGLSSLALVFPLLLEFNIDNNKVPSMVAVVTSRASVAVQSITGILWVIVGLLDDRFNESLSTSTKQSLPSSSILSPSFEEQPLATRRETFGLLVVGFAILILACLALMLSFWPVDEVENTTDYSQRRSTNPQRRQGEGQQREGLSEPLLSPDHHQRQDEADEEYAGLQILEDSGNIDRNEDKENNNPAQEENDDGDNDDNNNQDIFNDEILDGEGADSQQREQQEEQDQGGDDEPMSRIRGTRRLLKLAAPQVMYLYIGCITLLVRLPFSLSIPHFVSTTLGALSNGKYDRARREILWLFLLGTIDAFLDFWCIFWFGYANLRIVRGVRIDTFAAILRQEIGFFDKHTTGELSSRLTSDCGEMAGDLTWFFRFSIESVVRITGITTYMMVRSPRLGACALSIIPIVAIVNKYYGNWLSRNARKVQDALAQANSVAQETFSCIRTVIAFASEENEYKKYEEKIDVQYRLNVKQTYMTGIYYMFISTFLINTVVQGALLLMGSYLIQRGMLTGEILLAFMLYQRQLQSEMMNLFQSYSSLIKSSGAGDKVFSLLDRKPPAPATGSHEVRNQAGQLPIGADPLSIQLKDVQFAYPARVDHTVISGLNLTIGRGQTVALVGPSGCGKSTIVGLLQRFYDPTDGRIFINSADIRTFDIKAHRQRIGVVTQDPTLFSGSILSNITYGLPEATMEEAIEAARQANAHDFIMSFPNGYETEVGERGVQLSGGQKQRIAISRAIIKNPALLLLDEATSALDADSEEIVQAALDSLLNESKGTTTVIVAHRLRTVRNADMIAVVNNGRIVELGSHDELMQLDQGYYKGMVQKSMGDKLVSE